MEEALISVLADPDKRWGWLIYRLKLKGLALVDIANRAKVRPETLYQVKRRPYPRMEYLLAKAVGTPVTALFPERYCQNGLPLRRTVARRVRHRNRASRSRRLAVKERASK